MVRAAVVTALTVACLGTGFAEEPKARKGSTLGLETRQPDAAEEKAFGIETELAGRPEGRVVTAVTKDGAADKAGLKTGDLLIAFGDHTLYSQDDLDDALRAALPDTEFKLRIKRVGSTEETVLTVKPVQAEAAKGIQWEFAGPAQLEEALALAKKRKTKVMVGVSGAET